MNADGSGLTNVTRSKANESSFAWSPRQTKGVHEGPTWHPHEAPGRLVRGTGQYAGIVGKGRGWPMQASVGPWYARYGGSSSPFRTRSCQYDKPGE